MSSQTMHQGDFCWNELNTVDLKKAEKFYNSLLGWKFEHHEMGNNMNYTMMSHGDKTIGGMMQMGAEQKGHGIPSHWMSYISVHSADEIAQKAQSLGATIVVPATDVADFGRFVIIQDPTGAHIAFWESKHRD